MRPWASIHGKTWSLKSVLKFKLQNFKKGEKTFWGNKKYGLSAFVSWNFAGISSSFSTSTFAAVASGDKIILVFQHISQNKFLLFVSHQLREGIHLLESYNNFKTIMDHIMHVKSSGRTFSRDKTTSIEYHHDLVQKEKFACLIGSWGSPDILR